MNLASPAGGPDRTTAMNIILAPAKATPTTENTPYFMAAKHDRVAEALIERTRMTAEG